MWGVYCFAFVGLSVSPYTNLVKSITRELIAQGSSNLVWRLLMTSRWPLLNLGFLGQRSRSQWHLSLGGHACFTNIYCSYSFLKKMQGLLTLYLLFRLRVLSRLLSWKFLHREIREKGGAYGGGATCTNGVMSFFSYRWVFHNGSKWCFLLELGLKIVILIYLFIYLVYIATHISYTVFKKVIIMYKNVLYKYIKLTVSPFCF